MLRLYSSITQSHISYCVELFGNCNKSFLLPIIKSQKMCVRIVCDLKARKISQFSGSQNKGINVQGLEM